MNTKLETKKPAPKTVAPIETIDTVELVDITGGCSACGCGRPDVGAFAARQLRR